ncbi:hypothetical protein SESBI_50137, partial [Sesbania bispinosa]
YGLETGTSAETIRGFYQKHYMGNIEGVKKVDTESRFRLALDLVINSYNMKKNEVVKLAAENMKKVEEINRSLQI